MAKKKATKKAGKAKATEASPSPQELARYRHDLAGGAYDEEDDDAHRAYCLARLSIAADSVLRNAATQTEEALDLQRWAQNVLDTFADAGEPVQVKRLTFAEWKAQQSGKAKR